MPGQRGSEQRYRTKCVLVRLTVDEYDQLCVQADRAGATLAELARRRLAGRVVRSRTDDAMLRELRRQGGIAMLALRHPSLVQEGRAALAAIRYATRSLARQAP